MSKFRNISSRGVFKAVVLVAIGLCLTITSLSYKYATGPCDRPVWELDEPFYIPVAYDTAAGKPADGYYAETEPQPTWKVLTSRPNALLDYVLGKVGTNLKLSCEDLNLVLDTFCGLYCSILFVLFFVRLGVATHTAVAATIVVLWLPYLFVLDSSDSGFHVLFGDALPVQNAETVIAITRGIYTQVSYCILSTVLFGLAITLRSKPANFLRWVFLGLGCGLLLYVYFFAWIASALLVLGLLFSHQATYRSNRSMLPWLGFVLGFVACSVPALFILAQHSASALAKAPEITQYWYYSPLRLFELLALLFGFFWYLRTSAEACSETTVSFKVDEPRLEFIVLVLISLNLAELVCFNLQPLTGQALSPYRFARFYLQPLTSAFYLLLLGSLAAREGYRLLEKLAPASIIFIFLLSNGSALLHSPPPPESCEYQELTNFVKTTTGIDQVFAVFPATTTIAPRGMQHHTDAPIRFNALTRRKLLYSSSEYPNISSSKDQLLRERYTSWIFLGIDELLFECPKEIDLPGDLFRLVHTALSIRRREICKNESSAARSVPIENVQKMYRLDYVVIDHAIPGFKDWQPRSKLEMKLAWQSSSGRIKLYKVLGLGADSNHPR